MSFPPENTQPRGLLHPPFISAPPTPLTTNRDRYTGHTQSCAQCQRALKNIKVARRGFGIAAAALAAAALLACAVAICLASSSGGGAAAAASTAAGGSAVAQGVGGAPVRLAAAAVGVAGWLAGVSVTGSQVVGAVGAVGAMGRCVVLAFAALLLWRMSDGVLGGLVEKFYKGVWPPPRNTDES